MFYFWTDLCVMSDGDVSWVLLPGFPVYLHGGGVQQLDPHLCGLPDPMGLAQSHLKNLDIWRGVWGGGGVGESGKRKGC